MSNTNKLLIFAGAPSVASVKAYTYVSSSQSNNITTRQFDAGLVTSHDASNRSSENLVPWRSLPLVRQPLYNDAAHHNQLQGSKNFTPPDFLTLEEITTLTGDHEEFEVEDSMQAYTSLMSHDGSAGGHTSAASLTELQPANGISFMTETSFNTTTATAERSILPGASHLSDLEDIPPVSYITSTAPQTITLNLIVAVISVAQPRAITTRWGKSVTLTEILVSDETKSGFAITLWPSDSPPQRADSETPWAEFRRQDVLLMQNVALQVFRGKVYGHTLRRGLTRISLLWRRDGHGHYSTKALAGREACSNPQVQKTKAVRDWMLAFVGIDSKVADPKTKLGKSWDEPPDDTQ